MYLHFFEFICLLYISRLATGQNCSEISVKPTGTYQSETFTYAVGIPEIKFLIEYNCEQNITLLLSWKDMMGSTISNSTITVQGKKHTSGMATFSASNKIHTNVTLRAPEIPASLINITNGTVQKVINVTTRYCIEKYLNNTKNSSFEESYISDCYITETCGSPGSVKGRKTRKCGLFGNFIDATPCKKDEYEFHISSGSKGTTVNVPVGKKAIFKCEQRPNYSLNVELQNETIENVSHSHHGRKVFCNWTKDTGMEENSNNSTERSYVIMNVLSLPTFDKKSVSILDGDSGLELFLKISFWARSDEPITRSDLTVLHNDNKTDDYYFKPGEISQNILFHYGDVDEKNFGNYTVQVEGRDEFCKSVPEYIYANFANHGNILHTGYIVSIALGSVLLIVLIVFVVLFLVYRSRWRKDASDASKNSTSTLAMKHSNDGPARAQNNYHPPKPDQAPYRPPVPQSSQQYHNHDAQFDTDDDEFEPDDYEPMSPSERPPMPLPPATRGNPHQQQQPQQRLPRSPLPSVPPTRTLPRDLPPARVVSPPQSRGPPPRRAVAPPPPRSRAAPTPPYVNNRRPHKPYEYAGQEYEESDFQQEDYEVPVSKYR